MRVNEKSDLGAEDGGGCILPMRLVGDSIETEKRETEEFRESFAEGCLESAQYTAEVTFPDPEQPTMTILRPLRFRKEGMA
jgi:hypothetical protein